MIEITLKAEPPFAHPNDFLSHIEFRHGGKGDSLMHAIGDQRTLLCFGYELHVAPVEGTEEYLMTIGPLPPALPPQYKEDPPWTNVLLARYPAPQAVREGDAIALDLLVDHTTGRKIVDYIQISSKDKPASFEVWRDPDKQARDFTINDVPLNVSGSSLSINGKPAEGCLGSGGIVWFNLPNRGRLILSMLPNEDYGFQRAGVILDKTLSFQWNGDVYEAKSPQSILGDGGPYNLYVLFDPSYQRSQAICGSAWSVGAVLPKP